MAQSQFINGRRKTIQELNDEYNNAKKQKADGIDALSNAASNTAGFVGKTISDNTQGLQSAGNTIGNGIARAVDAPNIAQGVGALASAAKGAYIDAPIGFAKDVIGANSNAYSAVADKVSGAGSSIADELKKGYQGDAYKAPSDNITSSKSPNAEKMNPNQIGSMPTGTQPVNVPNGASSPQDAQSNSGPGVNAKMQGNVPASLADRGLPSATDAMTAYGVLNKNDGYTNAGSKNASATFASNGPVQGNEAGIGKNVGAPSPWLTGQQNDRQDRIDMLTSKIDNTTGGSIGESAMRGIRNGKLQSQIDSLSKVDSANRAADNATQNTSISDFTSKANAQHGIDSLQVQRENNARLGEQNSIAQQRQDYMAQTQADLRQSQVDKNEAMANRDPNAAIDAQQAREDQRAYVKARDSWKPDEHNGMPFPYKSVADHAAGTSQYIPVTADHYKALGKNPSAKDLADFKTIHGIDPVKSDWKNALK